MALVDRLRPTGRTCLDLPGPWPACAQGLLRKGAFWLHGSGWDGDLVGMPGGPRLESRWSEGRWATTLDGLQQEGSPLDLLQRAADQPHPWIGALSFELACTEAGLPHQAPAEGELGMVWLGLHQALRVEEGRAEVWYWGGEFSADLAAHLAPACALARPPKGPLRCGWDESTHRRAVESIQRKILDGEFYVANLCVPFHAAGGGDSISLALAAFRRAQAPFGAFLPLGAVRLLCLSMERVLGKEGPRLSSNPIKGSAAFQHQAASDAAAGLALSQDPKERAEHTMIVDLVRNDLGRVAVQGSVGVPEFMALRTFPTVQHLVSRVEAQARPEAGLAEILRSILPGGSVTGAPKSAVCAHLARAEAAPRGFYCGALGWICGSDLELALPIRTAQLCDDRLIYWAGGGITLRSDASKEWDELHMKTQVLGVS